MQIRRFPRGAVDLETRPRLAAVPARDGIEGISVTQQDRPEGGGGEGRKSGKLTSITSNRRSTSLVRRLGGGKPHDDSLERWKDRVYLQMNECYRETRPHPESSTRYRRSGKNSCKKFTNSLPLTEKISFGVLSKKRFGDAYSRFAIVISRGGTDASFRKGTLWGPALGLGCSFPQRSSPECSHVLSWTEF
jgi:hypothetical protein